MPKVACDAPIFIDFIDFSMKKSENQGKVIKKLILTHLNFIRGEKYRIKTGFYSILIRHMGETKQKKPTKF